MVVETETDRDWTKVVETETLTRLSLFSGRVPHPVSLFPQTNRKKVSWKMFINFRINKPQSMPKTQGKEKRYCREVG